MPVVGVGVVPIAIDDDDSGAGGGGNGEAGVLDTDGRRCAVADEKNAAFE